MNLLKLIVCKLLFFLFEDESNKKARQEVRAGFEKLLSVSKGSVILYGFLFLIIFFSLEEEFERFKKQGAIYNSSMDSNLKAALLAAEVGGSVSFAVLIKAGWNVTIHEVDYAKKRNQNADFEIRQLNPPHLPGSQLIFSVFCLFVFFFCDAFSCLFLFLLHLFFFVGFQN
jgi:hypothetical protein